MIVSEHRPPLRRIDYSRTPRAPEPIEPEGVRELRELGLRIRHQRIWELLRQSAEGCNAMGGEG